MSDQLKNLKDRAWLTARAHMTAEKRFREYDLISHLCVIYYSLWIILYSVYFQYMEGEQSSILAFQIFLSATLITISAVIYGMRFGEIALKHREAYLRLDRLKDTSTDEFDFAEKYHSIIETYPNHHDIDFNSMLFDRIVLRKQKIYSGEVVITMPFCLRLKTFLSQKIHYLFYVFLLALPPTPFLILIFL